MRLEPVIFQSALSRAEGRLPRFLKLSLYVHLGFLSLLLIKFQFFPGKPIEYFPTLRVDLVGLPDILKKDLHKIPPKTESKEITKDIPEKVEPKVKETDTGPSESKKAPTKEDPMARKNRMSKALDRMKALQRIEEFKKNIEVKGNTVSPGTTLTGEARESAEATYLDNIHEGLKANWVLPVWLARQELSAQVRLFIDTNGLVKFYKFEKLSGHEAFDDAVKTTIQKSQPFLPPPEDLASQLEENGILVGFPL